MMHPDTEVRFINEVKGYGVFATKFIPKGTITWVLDDLDEVFTPEREKALNPYLKKALSIYCFTNNQGDKILCWDNAKYVNHSFNPSCFSTAYDFEIAIRDIFPDDELTDDYGYLNIEQPFYPIDEEAKRKVVYPDDIRTYYQEWDKLVAESAPTVLDTAQP
jgi:SET domain-containing protein